MSVDFGKMIRGLDHISQALDESQRMSGGLLALLDHIEAAHDSCPNCIRVLREFIFKSSGDKK